LSSLVQSMAFALDWAESFSNRSFVRSKAAGFKNDTIWLRCWFVLGVVFRSFSEELSLGFRELASVVLHEPLRILSLQGFDLLREHDWSLHTHFATSRVITVCWTMFGKHVFAPMNWCDVLQTSQVDDSPCVMFLCLGELIGDGPTETIFTQPNDPRTRAYIEGAFG